MKTQLFEPGELRVKICGITRESDACEVIDAGADALGFNFWPRSKRYLEPMAAFPWIRELPEVTRIAVVVNPEIELLERIHEAGCFDAIQFHGDEAPEFCAEHGGERWIKAFAVCSENRQLPRTFLTTDFLLDAPTAEYGGSGIVANWTAAANFVESHSTKRFFLAGGLTPANVAAAVRGVRPHGVDVASGVESSPGIKDLEKVQEFIRQAKVGAL